MSRFVKVRVAWIKERIDAGDFEAGYCPTNEMKSDGLTIPEGTEDHIIFRNNLGMFSRDIPKERAVHFGAVSVMGMHTHCVGMNEHQDQLEHDKTSSRRWQGLERFE